MSKEINSSPQISEDRKIRKPIIEKRRRARINESLETLKKILLDCNPDRTKTKNLKLEKADILEMTVRYLQYLKTTADLGIIRSPAIENKVTQICPADSSTNDRVVLPAGGVPVVHPYTANKIMCMYKNWNTTTVTRYSGGGVVYVSPSMWCGSNRGASSVLPHQPHQNPVMESVWRPW
ncbi:hypothetical protein NQ315_013089 [Exocentrus adspersus]|uniref:BHLH domain-containing protein n=1 Tax=Exocentrus adspersus TaxID=1586481 RepID=A0AAV8VX32_9CUCU|nr:hypothetical protein NQ315_013089 [Exocentrus adspersus]